MLDYSPLFHHYRCINWIIYDIIIRGILTCEMYIIINLHWIYWVLGLVRPLDGLVQERCNSSALAMELRLSCANPSTSYWTVPLVICQWSMSPLLVTSAGVFFIHLVVVRWWIRPFKSANRLVVMDGTCPHAQQGLFIVIFRKNVLLEDRLHFRIHTMKACFCCFYTPVWKTGRIEKRDVLCRGNVRPSVRPSAFFGLFFNMLWDINLKLGIYIQ